MPRNKNPLGISYYQQGDSGIKTLAEKVKQDVAEIKQGKPPTPHPLNALENVPESFAALALYPEMMATECPETTDFKACYARWPDATLHILKLARQHAVKQRRDELKREQKDFQTQAGVIRQFFMTHTTVAKRNNQYLLSESLDIPPTLENDIQMIPVEKLQDKDIARLLTTKDLNITAESVQVERGKLAVQSKIS
jgi:hypothetical protein